MELTTNIKLHKQVYGDNPDRWDSFENLDKDSLDTMIYALQEEVRMARGITDSLKDRLDGGLYSDGSPRVPEELIQARDPMDSLKDMLALRSNNWVYNSLNVAPQSGDGIPDIMSGSVSGDPKIVIKQPVAGTQILFDINGYVQVVDIDTTEEERTILLPSGSTDTVYIYAEKGSDMYPVFGYSENYGEVENAVYIGEAVVTSSSIAITTYRMKRIYESGWQSITYPGDQLELVHNLGATASEIYIKCSVDGNAPFYSPGPWLVWTWDNRTIKVGVSSYPSDSDAGIFINNWSTSQSSVKSGYINVTMRY